jgi:uncharacterized alkaline shock family protein YloU
MSEGYVLHGAGGSISIAAGALATIVQRAAESVEGARVRRRRRGLDVRVEDGEARVDVALSAPYGTVLPDLGRDVQERVAAALATMCGLEAVVDVAVEELEGP